MNPNAPYNSGAFHFTQKAKVYCAKIIPLVFDNTLSYYESLCGFVAKVNEMVDALNAQNMNIIEFTHMVELEMQKFESYIEQRQQEFETRINEEWEAEKLVNQQFREQLTSEWNSFRNEIDLRIQTFMAAFREEWLEWKTDTMNDLNTFKTNLEEQQDDFEEHILSLQTSFEQREQAARVAFQNNLNSRLQQWETDTLTLFQTSIENWEDDTKDDLEAEFRLFITQEIGGQVATLSTQINMVAQSVSREATARQEGDQALQNQINQLTPTGSIKADTPDQNGNSQLYTVDDSTTPPTRTNIFPKINPQGEDDRKYFTPDQDEMKLAADWNIITQTNDRGFVIANNQQINGQTALTTLSMFAIKKSLIQGAGNNAVHDLGLLDIQIFPIMKNYGNIPEDVNILIMNDSTRTDYNVRYADISGITYLIIPIIIVNRSTNDILQNNLQLYCSFSQYLGGMSVIGAGGVTVDDQLSTTSTNPVENRVITNNFDNYVPYTTYTQEMATKASVSGLSALTQVVNGKASQTDLTTGLATKVNISDVTATPTQGSTNPISSGGVYDALQGFSPSVQDATYSTKGVVKVGANLEVNAGELSVPVASKNPDVRGVVGVGNNIKLTNGFIDVDTATYGVKGLMSVGNNLTVDNNGNVSVPVASLQQYGVCLIGNNVNGGNGVIQVADGDYNVKGVLGVGANLTCQNSIVDVPVATAIQRGVVAVGNGIDNNNGEISVPHGTSSVYGSVRAVDSQAFTGNSDVPNMTLFNTLLAGKANTTDVQANGYGNKIAFTDNPQDGASVVLTANSSNITTQWNVASPYAIINGLGCFNYASVDGWLLAIRADLIGYDGTSTWNTATVLPLIKNNIFITGNVTMAINSAVPRDIRVGAIYSVNNNKYATITLTSLISSNTYGLTTIEVFNRYNM